MSYTSDQHEWAKKANEGDAEHSGFYWIYADRAASEAFGRSTDGLGQFVQLRDGRWVWSAGHERQWHLN
jgi:amylosucrase